MSDRSKDHPLVDRYRWGGRRSDAAFETTAGPSDSVGKGQSHPGAGYASGSRGSRSGIIEVEPKAAPSMPMTMNVPANNDESPPLPAPLRRTEVRERERFDAPVVLTTSSSDSSSSELELSLETGSVARAALANALRSAGSSVLMYLTAFESVPPLALCLSRGLPGPFSFDCDDDRGDPFGRTVLVSPAAGGVGAVLFPASNREEFFVRHF